MMLVLVSRRLSLAIVSDCSRGFCGSKIAAGDGSMIRQVVRLLAAPARAAARTKGTRFQSIRTDRVEPPKFGMQTAVTSSLRGIVPRDDGGVMRTSFRRSARSWQVQ